LYTGTTTSTIGDALSASMRAKPYRRVVDATVIADAHVDHLGSEHVMQDVQGDSQRGFRRGLLAAVVGGALWRFGILIADKWRQPLFLNDSLYYSAQAQQLADGRWFREIFVDQPGAEHGPLTSMVLATVSWVSQPLPWQRLMTVLLGIGTIAVIGLLARRVGGPRVGVIAALIAAAYPNLWMNDGLVMSESLSMLLVASLLLVAHRALTTAGWPVVAAVGLLAGLGALARSELALLVPGLAAMFWFVGRPESSGATNVTWRTRAVRPAVVVGVAVLVVSPWVAFNLARFERPVTLTTNDGTTLLGSYCDDSFTGPNIGGWSLLCVVNEPRYSVDEEPSVRSERQRSLAVSYARAHVRRLPTVVVARIGRSLDVYGLDSLVAQDVGEERYRWASWAGIVSWWALAIAAVVGVRRIDRRTRWLLSLPCVAVLITTVVFYGGHRIRSSMEPVVIVAAAMAVGSLFDRRGTPRDRHAGGDVSLEMAGH
jgi:4-amino-4-deoxy-L-arabinose transferase-like glycosyltransferase